jgi:ribonuclease HI
MKVIDVYSDGSSINNPGPSGLGIYCERMFGNKKRYRCMSVSFLHATSNQMELLGCLMAVIRSLKYISGEKQICIHTDSQYTIDAVTKWRSGWKLSNWISSTGTEVKNRDLIIVLGNLYDAGIITFNKVRGHSGIFGNERADTLAKKASHIAFKSNKADSLDVELPKLFKGIYDYVLYKEKILSLDILKSYR